MSRLASRKLWVAVLGGALVALGEQLGLDAAVSRDLVDLLGRYLLAQGAVDALGVLGQALGILPRAGAQGPEAGPPPPPPPVVPWTVPARPGEGGRP